MFSAIVTAFLTTALNNLGPNYQQQSALLLHQLLNGRDPSLAKASDPTAPFEPSGSAIAVGCLWFASLSLSLGASLYAMICKEWLTEYNSGADPVVDLHRACQRQIRFMAFLRWNVHTLIALLPPFLHLSVLLFFAGAVVYLWQINVWVATVCLVIGGTSAIAYSISTLLPIVTKVSFHPYSTMLLHRFIVVIGDIVILVVDVVVHAGFLALRYAADVIFWLFSRFTSSGRVRNQYMQARTILPAEYKHMRAWWTSLFSGSLDEIDTSQRIQEEAILWLSQMPLDPLESKAVASSLALISSSRPRCFPKPVITFLDLTIESSFRDDLTLAQSNVAIDCIFTLGHIKYQSVVDRNSDQDHDVGGVAMTPFVAWAAQQVTIGAFDENPDSPHAEATRARLLMAAAWLSPVDAIEVAMPEGESLKIQDRWEFVEKIKAMLEWHIGSDEILGNEVLIHLVHGMHACIPRGNYGSTSSIISFLPLICEDYSSPWSEDESTLRALITYALDLLLPSKGRKPLVEREIGFDELASEFIDALMVNTGYTDVVTFGFWLVYRVPYALRSRTSTLADITHIWTLANDTTPEDHRERMNLHAISAFVAVAQHRAVAGDALPKLGVQHTLNLLNAALEGGCSRSVATYAAAIMLNLGTPMRATNFTRGIDGELIVQALYTVTSDLERDTAEENIIDLHIYSALALPKLHLQVDVERAKALIKEVERTIGDPVVEGPGFVESSGTDPGAGLDRVRWKAIYLSGLLSKFVPPDEELVGRLREKVRTLLQSGGLPLVGDCDRCLEPLAIGQLGSIIPAAQWGPVHNAFEAWIDEFPLSSLAGSVTSVRQ